VGAPKGCGIAPAGEADAVGESHGEGVAGGRSDTGNLGFYFTATRLAVAAAGCKIFRPAPGQSGEGRKLFFFGKKNQKTFESWACLSGKAEAKYAKVFCFFFTAVRLKVK
jgi:hypothetical protein